MADYPFEHLTDELVEEAIAAQKAEMDVMPTEDVEGRDKRFSAQVRVTATGDKSSDIGQTGGVEKRDLAGAFRGHPLRPEQPAGLRRAGCFQAPPRPCRAARRLAPTGQEDLDVRGHSAWSRQSPS